MQLTRCRPPASRLRGLNSRPCPEPGRAVTAGVSSRLRQSLMTGPGLHSGSASEWASADGSEHHGGSARTAFDFSVVPIGRRHDAPQDGRSIPMCPSRAGGRCWCYRCVSPMTSPGRAASRAARVGAGLVASGAAALSFRGTADFAEKSRAVDPGWGWIVPLVVEAGVLTAAAIAWVRSGDGMTARVETVVMASLLTLSVVINVAHAAAATLLGHVVAATPPLVLLVAAEGLLREQRRVARQMPPSRTAELDIYGPLTDLLLLGDSGPDGLPTASARQRPVTWQSVEGQSSATAEQAGPREPSLPRASDGADLPSTDGPMHPSGSMSEPAALPSLLEEVTRALDAGEAVTGASVGAWLELSESTGLRRLRELRIRHPELNGRMRRVREEESSAVVSRTQAQAVAGV